MAEYLSAERDCDGSGACIHEWVVFSTALTERWLMVQCCKCRLHGVVEDPSSDEWSTAFHAPSRPYQWHAGERVTARPEMGRPLYVVRSRKGKTCECYDRWNLITPEKYERFPAEVVRLQVEIACDERDQLLEWARFLEGTDICSFLLECFVHSFEKDRRSEVPQTIHEIARRLKRLDDQGLHCSPAVVAKVLKEVSKWNQTEPLDGNEFGQRFSRGRI